MISNGSGTAHLAAATANRDVGKSTDLLQFLVDCPSPQYLNTKTHTRSDAIMRFCYETEHFLFCTSRKAFILSKMIMREQVDRWVSRVGEEELE